MKNRLRTKLPHHVRLFLFLVTLLFAQSAWTREALGTRGVIRLSPWPPSHSHPASAG
jgi:hypothetical protein